MNDVVDPDLRIPEVGWSSSDRELAVAHDYDTDDRDLERLGMTISRLPLEAGVVWRLYLPRGERIEAWEPGTGGLVPPPEIANLIEGVAAGKPLVPAPPLPAEPGARKLREALEAQRYALLQNEPGVRVGGDPENLHAHRVAARRTRAFLRAARGSLDPDWRRSVSGLLGALGEVTGPVRDLDVLIAHVRDEVDRLDPAEASGGRALLSKLERELAEARVGLLEALDGEGYRRLAARLNHPPRLREGVPEVPLPEIARREFRHLVRSVDKLGKNPGDKALHTLRISLKRARYAAELSAPETEAGRSFLTEAKGVQDLLGEHQDATVAEAHLRKSAVVDEQTAAAFAAGRIAERQLARRARVRAALPKAWKQLRKRGSRIH